MNAFEGPQPVPVNQEQDPLVVRESHRSIVQRFLQGEAMSYLSPQTLEFLAHDVATFEKEYSEKESKGGAPVTYNKHTKTFSINGVPVTRGQIIASRHERGALSFPQTGTLSFEEKALQTLYRQTCIADRAHEHINAILANALAEVSKTKDELKSRAYSAIAERSEKKSTQLGVIAEQMMIGVAEMIAVDRPDLKLRVFPANAYEDVEHKIDFIIDVDNSKKRRGAIVDVDEGENEHKSIGIQFTIDSTKANFKKDQIEKAKQKNIGVHDIVYVELGGDSLRKAVQEWEKRGKPTSGIWTFLPHEAKKQALSTLFHSVLTIEQEESLLKKI